MGGAEDGQEVEAREDGAMATAGVTLVAGLGGLSFGVAGAAVFPFVPSTIAGPILAVTSLLTCWAALVVLCSRDAAGAAHRATILCMVVQIASAFAVLVSAVGASYNFCATKKPCFVFPLLVPGDKCDEDTLRGCIDDLSYFCHKVALNANMTYLGQKHCDTTLSDRCNGGHRFWGFDDRDDCLEFYVQKDRILPRSSKGFIIAGGLLQFACTALLTTTLRKRF